MIEKVIEYSIRNPLVVVFISLGVALWGLHATINTPVDAIPDLSENQVIVFADWPGRSPKEIEDQVTYPLSVSLQGLAGVKSIRATSEFGFSMLNIIFDDGVEFYFARQRILEKLSVAKSILPADVAPYLAPDTTALGQIFWYTVEGNGYDLGRLRAIQDWYVRYQLYSVPGVAEVASVGGLPIEYQVDIDPNKLRSYRLSLGDVYSAIAKSNSSVGGRVVQKANSEYLVRSIGWINSVKDIEQTVIRAVDGVPVHVGDVGSVQLGSSQRRNVLEKDGSEAVGGVVLMRFGENPLAVTERIKAKVDQLQSGLPSGVRIIPFYDRTKLIESAVDTVSHTLLEESFVASLVIFVIMRHIRSALIICIMLPLSVGIAFIMMRALDISSNIMSLSGIAISIGVLVDAAIVMVDQAAHTLHGKFGNNKIEGDTRELLIPALRTVGRPVFFSMLIMILSFVPVFALTGMEGKMFHPLAFTKSFALIGVSLLSITLVPAIIPWLMRGRMRDESDSWLVRRVIEIYRPVLNFVMDHPWPVVWIVSAISILGAVPSGSRIVFSVALALSLGMAAWASWGEELSFRKHWKLVSSLWSLAIIVPLLFAVHRGWRPSWIPEQITDNVRLLAGAIAVTALVTTGMIIWILSRLRFSATLTMVGSLIVLALIARQSITPLGREFMPPLDEGSILDMPVTIPRASVTQVSADLITRDTEIRLFPEIESVVGKAGRAETPTDPAPLDMVETVVNLRDHAHWPKRELRYEDAERQIKRVLKGLIADGIVSPSVDTTMQDQWISESTMFVLEQFDQWMRTAIINEQAAFQTRLQHELVVHAIDNCGRQMQANKSLAKPIDPELSSLIESGLPKDFALQLAKYADKPLITKLTIHVRDVLASQQLLLSDHDPLILQPGLIASMRQAAGELLGLQRESFDDAIIRDISTFRFGLWETFTKELNWRLFDNAVPLVTQLAMNEIKNRAKLESKWYEPANEKLSSIAEQSNVPWKKELFLWQRSKSTLLSELDSVVRMPGWGNIWTQPIINRIDMLATGVNTMLGVRVFGDKPEAIAQQCNEIAAVLKKLRGAVDVSADQVVGEGYIEIDIDRERAARYGISVGDIQETIETALGGRIITITVEGRERFPVRVRYARDYRDDELAVGNLLVASGRSSNEMNGANSGSANSGNTTNDSTASTSEQAVPLQVPLSQVAHVRVVQGPSMIRSENGLLRSYVRLNVRDRDIVGFVEEAQKAVASAVKMPAGTYIEWTGQFEHELRARRTLSIIVPIVTLTIFILLFVVYHDLADTLVVMCLTVPGAIFGGILFQYLFGYNFSVAVWVGFIACFGLATEGGLVMLVYLREAVDQRGGIENLTLAQLRQAVMDGAVHRCRPKLMTELTAMIGLAPMLWASGTGSEIMQPMAAPVLGGILVADEVIDLLLPVLFYKIRVYRWRKIQNSREELSIHEHPIDAERLVLN
ncbi:MAG: efflux RND transporter permease subunit [Pirellulaceae bacterium]|nr:efflux RND transporter permease subunit [Pirellulaceae bacterium]